jgi:hypothetical protein
MAMHDENRSPRNSLLAVLKRENPGLDPRNFAEVELNRGNILEEPAQPIRHVYFPHDCVISLTIGVAAGATAETATVGREGMTGFGGILGDRLAFARSVGSGRGPGKRTSAR